MKNLGKSSIMRLKKVLLSDKALPTGLLNVLFADMNDLLKSYFDFDINELSLDLTLNEEGRHVLRIETPIERVRNVRSV